MSHDFTLAKIREHMLQTARLLGESFTVPHDDWTAVAELLGERPVVVGLQPLIEEDKDLVPAYLERLFLSHRPAAAGLIISCWVRSVKADDPQREAIMAACASRGVAADPLRQEILLAEFSDGLTSEVWQADISRFPDRPPLLGPWQQNQVLHTEGRFADLLLNTFRRTSKRRGRP